ncbi:MAG TPA: enolase C-terminal domain-like protein [Candidatus Methylomirabilis sp.]|jgi:hypothetical protein
MSAVTPAPRLRILEVRLSERDVCLRMPFRFGVVTLTRAPQAFLRARIALENGREAWGVAAELLVPKWFDKNAALSNEENFEQLREAVRMACRLYTADPTPRSAFGLFAANYRSQMAACAERRLDPLVAGFGPALLDRAVLDGLCHLHGLSFFEAVRANLPGVAPVEFVPELSTFAFGEFLARLHHRETIHARHTVGLIDPITLADLAPGARVGDGLPETLEEVMAAYGHTYFKLKVCGDAGKDLARLRAIAAVLDRLPEPYRATLDGNEQYADVGGVLELWQAMEGAPDLRRLREAILFIEQPIARAAALGREVSRLSGQRPVIIDESDAELDAFPRARRLGYRGVSSKTCKGLYKSLLNAARCEVWNREAGRPVYFMSGEDLTCQAGVSVQQDLALVSLLGLEHVERNGHHYVNGMAGAPAAEQRSFLAAHPDLYREENGTVRLRIEKGRLAIGSLACPGYAVGAEPDWGAMREVPLSLS